MLVRNTIDDIRNEFVELYLNDKFVSNKNTTGSLTIEIINANFEVKPEDISIFGSLNEYAHRELAWYLSESLSVKDIPGECPSIWKECASKDDKQEINSNYGYLVFNEANYSQYRHALQELINDPSSRRACHIYTRPSIWNEYNKDGKSDYICTFATQQFIRDNNLVYCVSMRSNDAVTGFKNDLFWARYVAKRMICDLNAINPELKLNSEPIIYWSANSLHVYARSFPLIHKYIEQSNNKDWINKLYIKPDYFNKFI